MFENTFIDGCLYGTVELEDLEKFVEYWHTHDTKNTLREFLGMLPYEYEEWLKQGDVIIRDILRCRADRIPFQSYEYMTSDEKLAARSYSIDKIKELKDDDKFGD